MGDGQFPHGDLGRVESLEQLRGRLHRAGLGHRVAPEQAFDLLGHRGGESLRKCLADQLAMELVLQQGPPEPGDGLQPRVTMPGRLQDRHQRLALADEPQRGGRQFRQAGLGASGGPQQPLFHSFARGEQFAKLGGRRFGREGHAAGRFRPIGRTGGQLLPAFGWIGDKRSRREFECVGPLERHGLRFVGEAGQLRLPGPQVNASAAIAGPHRLLDLGGADGRDFDGDHDPRGQFESPQLIRQLEQRDQRRASVIPTGANGHPSEIEATDRGGTVLPGIPGQARTPRDLHLTAGNDQCRVEGRRDDDLAVAEEFGPVGEEKPFGPIGLPGQCEPFGRNELRHANSRRGGGELGGRSVVVGLGRVGRRLGRCRSFEPVGQIVVERVECRRGHLRRAPGRGLGGVSLGFRPGGVRGVCACGGGSAGFDGIREV